MSRLKGLIAAAAIGIGFAVLPAEAAPMVPVLPDAVEGLSPLTVARHRKKIRRHTVYRRHHQKRRRVIIGDHGNYEPYYYVPRRAHRVKRRHSGRTIIVIRRPWYDDYGYYGDGYGYGYAWPHPQIGAWIYPYD